MLKSLLRSNIAIIGGGAFCKAFLQFLSSSDFAEQTPNVLGVADIDENAPGMVYAGQLGIYTTVDYKALYRLKNLEILLELTNDNSLSDIIRMTKPENVKLIDHISVRSLWSLLQIEAEKRRALKEFKKKRSDLTEFEYLFQEFAGRLERIITDRAERYEKIERNLVENERALAQIVDSNTIPMFVINADHIITHWNHALERLTGYSAQEMVGTKRQWEPFWKNQRPSMADIILDQPGEAEIKRLYGTNWRKSAFTEGAYEAEAFFPGLGEEGKWCWFTAAPIKAPDGSIVGAMETLQDVTDKKKAEEQKERHHRLLIKTAQDLAESERTTAQIIQGSTIPTFVIDRHHVVTHWNRALEKLTGFPADRIVGTNQHWRPFRAEQRPLMADVILDQLDAEEIKKYYGANWRKSALIDGAYEAEEFFPSLGENGRWCWFTAAPIKAPDGKIIGAIETLWDKTEEKLAEDARKRHNRELATLCSIYSALNAPLALEDRINVALEEIRKFLSADSLCIFLQGKDGLFHLKYTCGDSNSICRKNQLADNHSIISRVAMQNELVTFENLPEGPDEEIGILERKGLKSLVYIPINAKEKKAFGVIRIGSRKSNHFLPEEKNVLELISNRIGVTIENAMLHEQYIKSEEKYRSLFNNDPNPIFIIDSKTLEILDTNHRAQDGYGYSRREFYRKPFLSLGDKNDEELENALKNISKDQSILFSKKRHYKKGGIPFYVNINVSYGTYSENDVLIATTTDITESIEKETQLIQASKMTTLGQMAAGIAHEINQPLNVIQVCADFFLKMLKKGERIPDEDLKTLANDISSNVQRASGIIKHMRDFARQSEVVRSKVNINAPIMDVFKVMGHQLKAHQVKVVLDLDPDIPAIMAEHNRLEQVFINLVSNAIDAMDENAGRSTDPAWKKCLTIRSFHENGHVLATVSDTGTGMSPEVMDKIFEPFFTTKEVGRGTGLGISISYSIVKDYNGDIEIESQVGVGTTFKLKFPALDSGTVRTDA